MKRPDSFFFKKKRITQAHEFFEKKGGGAIIFARFLPVVRTFVPIVAGMADMTYRKYFIYSILGALAWVASMTSVGFILGKNEWVIKNLDKIVILIIVVTTGPVLFKMFFGRAKATPTTEK
jgi:membrane-associated protein